MVVSGDVLTPSRFGIIIGAMKCGTTSLFNHLASHPEIAPCRTKEPDFFCREEFRPEDLGDYFALWEWQPGVHRIAVEASANYTKIPSKADCAERIARCPDLDVRFIYCMRNPIDRIVSHVHHGVYAGWTPPLDEGITDHVIDCSKYAMQLDPYVEHFGRERLLLVVLEDFEREPRQNLRRIFEFLGVDSGFSVPGVDRLHNSASDHFVEHPVWTRLRGIGIARAAARMVPVGLRKLAQRRTGRRIDLRRELLPDERSMVLNRIAPDLARLRTEYGIDPAANWGIELR